MERLVATWNHLPGVKPVKKFMDRKTGAARIWNAIQNLVPTSDAAAQNVEPAHDEDEAPLPAAADETVVPETVTEAQFPHAPTEPVPETVAAEATSVAPKKRKARTDQAPVAEPTSAPAASKKDIVLALLRRQEVPPSST
jgi:hypothetical protein